MNNFLNILKLKVTNFKVAYHFDKSFDNFGFVSGLIHASFESTLKKIDSQLSKEDVSYQSFFRSKLDEEKIMLHPKLKDFINPPRGYSLSFNVDINNSLLIIEINLFGKFKSILPHLLPFLPSLFFQKAITKVTFAYICDGYGRKFETIEKFRSVPLAEFSLDFFKQARFRGKLLKINLQSPIMLRKDQNQLGSITFHDLIGALIRRASMLSFVYEDANVPDFEAFYDTETKNINIESVQLRWNKWDIPVREGKSEFSIAGYTGIIRFHSDKHTSLFQHYLPLLLFSQYIQAGEKTNYGGGKYMVSDECYTFI